MLWMKGWLESRWRLAMALGIILLTLGGRYAVGVTSAEDAHRMMGAFGTLCIFASCFVAGSGIKTQPAFRETRGMSGSVYFTLSLPVSRLRLLCVRACLGLLEGWAVTLIVGCGTWILFPLVRGNSTPWDLVQFVMAAFAFLSVFHAIAVVFGTFLDDVLAVMSSVGAFIFLFWLSTRIALPRSINIFRACNEDSPLLTHTLAWSQVAVSVALAGMLFVLANKIIAAREY